MEWDKALAELLLEEPEIRSWLGVEPRRDDVEPQERADSPLTRVEYAAAA